MREGAKREMRIYPKFEFLCIKISGEETTERKRTSKKTNAHKKRVKGLLWEGLHIAWRAAKKTKVEEDFRF